MTPSKPHIFFLILSICTSISSSADLTTFVYKGCANQKFQDPSGISSQNLKSLYQTLVSQSSTTNFYRTTAGNDQLPTSVTGVYQCRGDLSNADCNTCVKKAPETIQRVCGGDTIAARVQLIGCYLRYEVVGFPPAPATELLFKQCGSGRASGSGFDSRLESALLEVEKGVVGGKGFYSGEYQSVYVLGQCEGGLSGGECVNCVRSAAANGRSVCGSSISGQIYLQQCYISYTYYPNGVTGSGTGGGGGGIEATETGGGDGRRNTQKTVAIIMGGLAGLFLGIAFLLVLKSAFKKKKEKHSYGSYGFCTNRKGMIGRRFISFLRRNPSLSSSSPATVAAEEAKPKSWGRRIVTGGLICVTGGVALSALDDLLIYHSCSSKAMEKASKNKAVIDAIGEPISRGPWYNASLAVTHKRHSVSCTFPVSGPHGTGIFQLRAVRNGEESLLSFFRPRDWEILIMEALLHVPENEEKNRTFRIRISDDLSPPACQPCLTGCTRSEEPNAPENKQPQAT